jgi:hypothetical protein
VTSFPAAARRVRERDRTPRDKLLALRECVLRFPPYGFRATWHHLVVSANVPSVLDDDLDSLLRAVDELAQARRVFTRYRAAHAARRRREKARGRRVPRGADRWLAVNAVIAYCPDFEKHPTGRLAVEVRRIIAAFEAEVDVSTTCRACGLGLTADAPCPRCGVDPSGVGARRDIPAHRAHRWRELWLTRR